jgi:uncharacterized membrane protein YfcA
MIDVFPALIILATGIFTGMFGTLAGGRIGNVWIKRLFMLAAFVMAIKLVL